MSKLIHTEDSPSLLGGLSPIVRNALTRNRVVQRLPATKRLNLGHALSPIDLLSAGRHLLFTVITIPFHYHRRQLLRLKKIETLFNSAGGSKRGGRLTAFPGCDLQAHTS